MNGRHSSNFHNVGRESTRYRASTELAAVTPQAHDFIELLHRLNPKIYIDPFDVPRDGLDEVMNVMYNMLRELQAVQQEAQFNTETLQVQSRERGRMLECLARQRDKTVTARSQTEASSAELKALVNKNVAQIREQEAVNAKARLQRFKLEQEVRAAEEQLAFTKLHAGIKE